jgi:hypothetical protein
MLESFESFESFDRADVREAFVGHPFRGAGTTLTQI